MKGVKQTIQWMVCSPERASPSKLFPPSVHRSSAANPQPIRAPGLPHIGSALLYAAQGAHLTAGRRTADRGHHRADRRVRTLCTARQAIAQKSAERGYRMITGMPDNSGPPLTHALQVLQVLPVNGHVHHKRVERIWRREGRDRSRKNTPGRVGSG
jgi:hypothetical protein